MSAAGNCSTQLAPGAQCGLAQALSQVGGIEFQWVFETVPRVESYSH